LVRLRDLPWHVAEGLLALPLPQFDSTPWAPPPPHGQARVAIISTAGLHRRSDPKFAGGATDYRIIPHDLDPAELTMSHVSINFDRSGFQQDVNVVFPLPLLRRLAAQGEVASLARWHYSFMGATDPTRLEETGTRVAHLLKEDGVNAVLLVPV
jgi:D-proline reductase (dithiol) PrdB